MKADRDKRSGELEQKAVTIRLTYIRRAEESTSIWMRMRLIIIKLVMGICDFHLICGHVWTRNEREYLCMCIRKRRRKRTFICQFYSYFGFMPKTGTDFETEMRLKYINTLSTFARPHIKCVSLRSPCAERHNLASSFLSLLLCRYKYKYLRQINDCR